MEVRDVSTLAEGRDCFSCNSEMAESDSKQLVGSIESRHGSGLDVEPRYAAVARDGKDPGPQEMRWYE